MKTVAEYKKTKNRYLVLTDNALMKNPETGKWEKAVIYENYKQFTPKGYVDYPDSEKKTFVRVKSDFIKKFELCLDL